MEFQLDTSNGSLREAKVIETDRLILRRISVGDAEFMLELLNEPSFLRFIGDALWRLPLPTTMGQSLCWQNWV